MQKKIYLSMMVIAFVSLLIGGATFAMFTSQATNSDNTFATGTVAVTAGPQTYTVPVSNIAPGDSYSGSFTVKNDGTLKMWYKVTSSTSGDLFSGATPATVTPNSVTWTALEPNTEATINYAVALPFAADNSYQGDTGSLTFTVDAQQFANNPNPAP